MSSLNKESLDCFFGNCSSLSLSPTLCLSSPPPFPPSFPLALSHHNKRTTGITAIVWNWSIPLRPTYWRLSPQVEAVERWWKCQEVGIRQEVFWSLGERPWRRLCDITSFLFPMPGHEVTDLWHETCNPVSPNNPFLLISWSSRVFVTATDWHRADPLMATTARVSKPATSWSIQISTVYIKFLCREMSSHLLKSIRKSIISHGIWKSCKVQMVVSTAKDH